jgi:pimeloyl-ACP methyl ester carboxylesterase
VTGEARSQSPPTSLDQTAIKDEDGRIVRIQSTDGLSLACRCFDSTTSDRLPFLCLPGLSRNSRDFLGLGRFFSRHPSEPRDVFALDYRGRGFSDSDPNWRSYQPIVEAQDVLTVTAALGIARAILVGTSRGGIIAMLLGALRPSLIAGVVLNDIGPVIEASGLARIKSYLSMSWIAANVDDAAALLRSNAGAQFPGLTASDWKALAEAYFAETGQGLVPHYDPNLRKTTIDLDIPEKIPVLWPQLMSLAGVPLMAIRGEHSDILSPQTLAEMAERLPGLEQLVVTGQGHAPLLQDEPTLQRIGAFAQRCDR